MCVKIIFLTPFFLYARMHSNAGTNSTNPTPDPTGARQCGWAGNKREGEARERSFITLNQGGSMYSYSVFFYGGVFWCREYYDGDFTHAEPLSDFLAEVF